MEAYENGGHAYHATMPTDALKRFRDEMKETEKKGFDQTKTEQQELGDKIRALLESKGKKIRHCFFGAYQRKMVNCVSASAEAPHIEASIKRNQYPT